MSERRDAPSKRLIVSPPPARSDKMRRLLWRVIQGSLFRFSPAILHEWRCFLLRCFGARIASGAHPYPTARIWAPWNLEMGRGSCLGPYSNCYSVATVRLGANAVISQGSHLCSATHDHRDPDFALMVGEITIGEGAWIAAEAFVGPGVTVADKAVVGARAVVMKDVPAGAVVVGNPARAVSYR